MPSVESELRDLLAGRRDAWPAFLRRFAPTIFAVVQRRLAPFGRLQDAEDVAQDVFARLCAQDLRLLRSYDPARASLRTWLAVIAASSAIDHLRRSARSSEPLDAVPESALRIEAVEPAWLKYPPDLLSPRQALVLRLLYDRDLEVAEVAALLRVEPQTVRSLHHKALQKLRAFFREGGDAAATSPRNRDGIDRHD